MDIFKIISIALVTCITALLVKQIKPDFSVIIALCGGLIILCMTIDYVSQILAVFNNIVEKTGLNIGLFGTVLKIIGIGYITEWTANVCADTGQNSLSDKVLMAGKILIFVFALPIITNIIDIIIELLGIANV